MSVLSNGNTGSSVKTVPLCLCSAMVTQGHLLRLAIVSVLSYGNTGPSVKTVPLCLCSVMVTQGYLLKLCHCVCAQ